MAIIPYLRLALEYYRGGESKAEGSRGERQPVKSAWTGASR